MAYVSDLPVSRAVTHLFQPFMAFYARTVTNSKNARHSELLQLSDAELAERGLRRYDVVDRHYGDLFYS